eukprot:319766-Rhodomonas_salina.10
MVDSYWCQWNVWESGDIAGLQVVCAHTITTCHPTVSENAFLQTTMQRHLRKRNKKKRGRGTGADRGGGRESERNDADDNESAHSRPERRGREGVAAVGTQAQRVRFGAWLTSMDKPRANSTRRNGEIPRGVVD